MRDTFCIKPNRSSCTIGHTFIINNKSFSQELFLTKYNLYLSEHLCQVLTYDNRVISTVRDNLNDS